MDAWQQEVAIVAVVGLYLVGLLIAGAVLVAARGVLEVVNELRTLTDNALYPTADSMDYIARCFERAERRAEQEEKTPRAAPSVDEERFREQLSDTLDEARAALSRETIGQDVKDFL